MGEMVEGLQGIIRAGENSGVKSAELWISDGAARKLADELATMQLSAGLTPPVNTPASIYHSMKDGGFKFMGRPVVVADA